jgi:hypothetical protein
MIYEFDLTVLLRLAISDSRWYSIADPRERYHLYAVICVLSKLRKYRCQGIRFAHLKNIFYYS